MHSLLNFFFLFLLSFTGMVMADSHDQKAKEVFDSKFFLKSDEKGVKAILLRMDIQSFSIDGMLNVLVNELKNINRQARAQRENANRIGGSTKTVYEMQVADVMSDLYADYNITAGGANDSQLEQVRYTMLNVQNDEVVKTVSDVAQSEYWKKFKQQVEKVLLLIRPDVISVPGDKNYFMQRKVISEISKLIIDQAAKNSPEPFVRVLAEVFSQVEQMIVDQRHFNQNFLIYLLENYKAETFGLTDAEAAKAMSSIYHSRIGLMDMYKLRKVVAEWESYGWNNFYGQKRAANAVLTKYEDASVYNRVATKRICYSFAIVEESGKKKIVNLMNTAHQYSSKPSLAYDFEKPNKVAITRFIVKVAQIGVSAAPLPGFIKSQLDSFAKSIYKEQIITEGSLSAHFRVVGHNGLSSYFMRQTLNPFLR